VPLVGVSAEKEVAVNVGQVKDGGEPSLGRSGQGHLRVQVAKVSGRTEKVDTHSLLLLVVEAVEGLDQKHQEVGSVYQAWVTEVVRALLEMMADREGVMVVVMMVDVVATSQWWKYGYVVRLPRLVRKHRILGPRH
jgi:ABC-type hemin transport system ATPase subunit